MNELIRLNNVCKYYQMPGFTVKALDRVSVTIGEGEFVALVGPSGSGKSTLMNVLGCLDIPTGGEYWLDGKNVMRLSDARLAELRNQTLGFVFQSFYLMGNLTALDNVALPAKYRRMSGRASRALAAEAVERVGLGDRAKHLPKELSGGQQQRVAFARALICGPRVLLADEPTGNLDSKTGKEILEMICELNRQGMTVILVTHDEAVAAVAGRRLEILDGKIVRDIRKEAAV